MVMYQYNDREEMLQSGSMASAPKNISRKHSLESSGHFNMQIYGGNQKVKAWCEFKWSTRY